MNRRDLLKRTLAVGASGLLIPEIDPVRRIWAIDRTMIKPSKTNRMNVVMFDDKPFMKNGNVRFGFDLASPSLNIVRVTAISPERWSVDPLIVDDQLIRDITATSPWELIRFMDNYAAAFVSASR